MNSKRIKYLIVLLLSVNCFGLPAIYNKGGGFKPNKVITVNRANDGPLPLYVFTPIDHLTSDTRPVVVFFSGGGWKGSSPSQLYPQAAYLASRGIVAISVKYRGEHNGAQPFQSVEDAKSAIRYIRRNATTLGINPNKIVASGASAGGHLAAATATVQDFNSQDDDLAVSAMPNALVLFNPVFDNGPQGYGYDRVKQYYPAISPIDNLNGKQPPTLVFLGSRDKHIPVQTALLYEQRMEANGNRCETFIYPEQKHGFFNLHKSKNKEYFVKTLLQFDVFLSSLGFLNRGPTIDAWMRVQETR